MADDFLKFEKSQVHVFYAAMFLALNELKRVNVSDISTKKKTSWLFWQIVLYYDPVI